MKVQKRSVVEEPTEDELWLEEIEDLESQVPSQFTEPEDD
jgi:hypothetical protein